MLAGSRALASHQKHQKGGSKIEPTVKNHTNCSLINSRFKCRFTERKLSYKIKLLYSQSESHGTARPSTPSVHPLFLLNVRYFEMGLVICVPLSEPLTASKVDCMISEVCKNVIPHDDKLLLIPQPGKLMKVLRILKENDISYHFQDFAFKD